MQSEAYFLGQPSSLQKRPQSVVFWVISSKGLLKIKRNFGFGDANRYEFVQHVHCFLESNYTDRLMTHDGGDGCSAPRERRAAHNHHHNCNTLFLPSEGWHIQSRVLEIFVSTAEYYKYLHALQVFRNFVEQPITIPKKILTLFKVTEMLYYLHG